MTGLKEKIKAVNHSHILIAGFLVLVLLATSLVWFNHSTSVQADLSLRIEVYFKGQYRIAEGEIRQNLILYYIGAEEGLLLSDEEEDEFYREKVQELLDYYNDYYGRAGTGGELTEEDLATAGYTREEILKDDLYQRFCAAMYEAYYNHIEFLD